MSILRKNKKPDTWQYNIPHIGVYTICKNESKFVRQWVESMYCGGNGAYRAYILDTGSTDNTVELFHTVMEELGVPSEWLKIETKTYERFRFDTARNDNLNMIEEDADKLDALVSVDLDETMIADFWTDLRNVVREHPDFERVYYLYAWNHDDDGNPKRVFWYDKVHPVRGCRWKHPVHEELVIDKTGKSGTYRLDENKIYLHHWMDMTKPRSSYLSLLELRAEEEPDDICGLFYLVREYQFRDIGDLMALSVANNVYTRMISGELDAKDDYECLPFFTLAIADIYKAHGLKEEAEFFYKKALRIAGHLRQPYISYAQMAAYNGQHELALALMDEMEAKVPEKYSTWYECDYNWTWKPMQIRAVAHCWAGEYTEAWQIFENTESIFIRTPVDETEAEANGFYADWQWLKDYLANVAQDEEAGT